MDEVNFKDIRVLPTSLDLKGNSSNSLSNLLGQLQPSSVLKGLVVGISPQGDVIFNTAHGKFTAPNALNLQQGDTLTIRLAKEGEQISGTIITVNNVSNNSAGPLSVAFLRSKVRTSTLAKPNKPLDVTFDNMSKLPSQIKGKITYLNLSKISKSSLLYKTFKLFGIQNNIELPITLKASASSQVLRSPLHVHGEVSDNGKDGSQLIKTNFGIITTVNTKMPIGQKMILEITNVNNSDTNIDMKKEVSDFIFSLSSNWPLMKNLSINTLGRRGREAKVTESLQGKDIDMSELSSEDQVSDDAEFLNSQKFSTSGNLHKTIASKHSILASLSLQQTFTEKVAQGSVAHQSTYGSDHLVDNSESNISLKNPILPPKIPVTGLSDLITKTPGMLASLIVTKENTVEKDKKLTKYEMRQKTLGKVNFENQEVKEKLYDSGNLNNFFESLSDYETIKKLSGEYRVIKELLITNPENENDSNHWMSVMIPFYNGQAIEEQEVKFNKPSDQFMRFLVDVNFDMLDKIRIDGLIRFQNDNNSVISFDLIMKSKKTLDSELEKKIAEVFSFNQQICGIKGGLKFEEDADL